MKVSIFLINYNNAISLKKSIKSLLAQTYKNIEIIVYDDKSSDNSKKIINSFKGIKKIYARSKSKKGYLGQINGINECLKVSSGEIICMLDSDDFFKKNKISNIVNYLKKNKCDFVFDKPIYFKNKCSNSIEYKKWTFNNRLFIWPHFPPQSCITVKKSFLKKYIKILSYKKLDHIWFDFRISILNFMLNGKVSYIDKYLTFYQLSNNSASSKYLKFTYPWWFRRLQAHQFIFLLGRKGIKKKYIFLFDHIFTKVINFFLGLYARNFNHWQK